MEEYRTKIIEKAIENHLSPEQTVGYLKLLERTDYTRVMEVRIGVFAELTGEYKTICQRCNELNIESVGDLVRLGGRAFRKSTNVGVKTAALVSDTLASCFGITDWFSKESEE